MQCNILWKVYILKEYIRIWLKVFFYHHFIEVYQTTKEYNERHNNTIEITIITILYDILHCPGQDV